MAKATPVDPLESAEYGLQGLIVTMTAPGDIINGTIYIKAARIAAIIPQDEPVPDEFSNYKVYKTKGTIFPGLIELHNHLSYNCLPLWNVPKLYSNRNQWSGIPEYQQRISFPMNILGKTPGYVEAIVRYVECKCLAGGVTTSQGIMLFSNAGIKKYYRGVVRNVEDTDDADLPEVDAHIPDIAARDTERFFKQLQKSSCLLLHLSEGTNASARKHFEDLKFNDNNWAITPALTGIHCVALTKEDFTIMKQKGASMVWSPFSNLLLYGKTADIKSAKSSGITIALGSDWSPSGSKNLLGELKIAKLYSDENGQLFSNYELVAMATKNAAHIIKWDKELGTLEKGKRADLLVIGKQDEADPYSTLLHASEKSVSLVVINGAPRYGDTKLMSKFNGTIEKKKIGNKTKIFNLQQASANPVTGKLKLADAESTLKKGLTNIKKLATRTPPLRGVMDKKGNRFLLPLKAIAAAEPEWVLVLDHNEDEGEALRTHFDASGKPGIAFKKIAPMDVKPEVLIPIQLDALTVAGDKGFFKKVEEQQNLPDYIKTRLKKMYSDL